MSVLLCAFTYERYEILANMGMDIGAVIYVHKLPKKGPAETEFHSHDITNGMVNDCFAADLPYQLAGRLRDKALPIFRRTFYRNYRNRARGGYDWLEVNSHFENALQFYWLLLKRKDISSVIFSNVPHSGSSIILYFLCKELGIKTLIVTHSLVANYFWAADSIEGVGISGPASPYNAVLDVSDHLEMPFYMRGTKRMTPLRFWVKYVHRFLNAVIKILSLTFFYNKKSMKKSIMKLGLLREEYDQQWQARGNYDEYDAEKKFVYFPLHLQPEMTTDVQGGPYGDQIRAIEELVRALPEDVWVYVKENPKQTAFMRGANFFQRLKSINRVKYLDIDLPSFELTSNALAVATITGTAGWEALQMGKPVLVFGFAWYRKMPGVFDWNVDGTASVDSILNFHFEKGLLTQAAQERQVLLWKGVQSGAFESQIENFDGDMNEQQVAHSTYLAHQRLMAGNIATV